MKLSKNIQSVISKAGVFSLLLITFNKEVKAQLHPMGAMYFQNQYLANPAMAGLESGLRADLAYRKQWSSIPGAPETQSITADYGSSKKAGAERIKISYLWLNDRRVLCYREAF